MFKNKLNKIPRFLTSTILAKEIVNNSFLYYPQNSKDIYKLAKAHFTLFQNPKFSKNQSTLHLNTCISLLQSIKENNFLFKKLLFIAIFKRAEIFELNEQYNSAIVNYKKAIKIGSKFKHLSDNDILIFANSCMSIANILIFKAALENSNIPKECYYFSSSAVKYLLRSQFTKPNILSKLAFAFQTLGVSISNYKPEESMLNFNLSLKIIYKVNDIDSNKFIAQNLIFLKNIYLLKYNNNFNNNNFTNTKPIIYNFISTIYDFLHESLTNLDTQMIDLDFTEKLVTQITTINKKLIPIRIITNTIDALIFILKYLDYNFVLNLYNINQDTSSEYPDDTSILPIMHDNNFRNTEEIFDNNYISAKLDNTVKLFQNIVKLVVYCFYSNNKYAKIFSILNNKKLNVYEDALLVLSGKKCRVYKFLKYE